MTTTSIKRDRHGLVDDLSIRVDCTFDRTSGTWGTALYVTRYGMRPRAKLLHSGTGGPPEGESVKLASLVAILVGSWEAYHAHGIQGELFNGYSAGSDLDLSEVYE